MEVQEQTELLGIQLTSDLQWSSNIKAIYEKAMSKIWLIRRMKLHKLEPELIIYYYLKEIRVLVEQCVAVWISGSQKVALRIILEDGLGIAPKTGLQFFKIKIFPKEDCNYAQILQ